MARAPLWPPLDHRIALSQRHGWVLPLRTADCREIAASPASWLRRGLPQRVLRRIQLAVADIPGVPRCGARLSAEEVAAIQPAAEIGPAKETGPGGGADAALGRVPAPAPSFPDSEVSS